ncbi:hypothetical protein ACEPPN_008404 [Leptodophora sp. 'Broadleaf-Isolate-01']
MPLFLQSKTIAMTSVSLQEYLGAWKDVSGSAAADNILSSTPSSDSSSTSNCKKNGHWVPHGIQALPQAST